jgi:hypothetical protein
MGEQPRVEDRSVTGEEIVWGHPQLVTYVVRSVFSRCKITITCSAAGINFINCQFHHCTILVKKRFSNYQFFDVSFDACSFVGQFPGCELGFRDIMPVEFRGYVQACDFSAAKLDLVTINNSDVRSLRLPPWPHFAVLSSSVYKRQADLTGDPEWALFAGMERDPHTAAVVHIYRCGGKHGFGVPADQALAILANDPDIVIVPEPGATLPFS